MTDAAQLFEKFANKLSPPNFLKNLPISICQIYKIYIQDRLFAENKGESG